jgi:hypothetical protein
MGNAAQALALAPRRRDRGQLGIRGFGRSVYHPRILRGALAGC